VFHKSWEVLIHGVAKFDVRMRTASTQLLYLVAATKEQYGLHKTAEPSCNGSPFCVHSPLMFNFGVSKSIISI
jgi:hypothetical protein